MTARVAVVGIDDRNVTLVALSSFENQENQEGKAGKLKGQNKHGEEKKKKIIKESILVKLLRKTLKKLGTVSLYKIYRAMIKGQKQAVCADQDNINPGNFVNSEDSQFQKELYFQLLLTDTCLCVLRSPLTKAVISLSVTQLRLMVPLQLKVGEKVLKETKDTGGQRPSWDMGQRAGVE